MKLDPFPRPQYTFSPTRAPYLEPQEHPCPPARAAEIASWLGIPPASLRVLELRSPGPGAPPHEVLLFAGDTLRRVPVRLDHLTEAHLQEPA